MIDLIFATQNNAIVLRRRREHILNTVRTMSQRTERPIQGSDGFGQIRGGATKEVGFLTILFPFK